MVKFFGQQGMGWGNDQLPANGLALNVRLVNAAESVDTGWLDGNQPYDGLSAPQGDGSGVLLLGCSDASQKVLTVGQCVEGSLFVRIGLNIAGGSSLSFKSVAVFDPYIEGVTIDEATLSLQGGVYSAAISLTDSIVYDVTTSVRPTTQTWLRRTPQLQYLKAQQLDTSGVWSDVGCVSINELSDTGENITDSTLTARLCYAKCGPIIEATVVSASLSPGTLLSGIRLAAMSSPQGMPRLCSPVYFHYDVPSVPSFTGSLTASITGSITTLSGVKTYVPGAVLACTGTASGVVSNLYNSTHGIAALSGNVIAPVDEITSGRQVSSLAPFTAQTLTMMSSILPEVYSEAPQVTCTLYNFIGQTASMSTLLGARVDTISKPIPTQVTSGLGQFPANPGSDFGLAYDHTASLMSNQELMQVGGLLRTPPQVNYSLTLPAGSPDYTAASAEYTWRYATFVFAAMACMSSFSIVLQDIQGTNWGDYQTTAVDVQIYTRFVGPVVDTGWLDCNQFYDGSARCSGKRCAARGRHHRIDQAGDRGQVGQRDRLCPHRLSFHRLHEGFRRRHSPATLIFSDATTIMIPRCVHQLYWDFTGRDRPVPAPWQAFRDDVARLHPDWTVKLWGKTECEEAVRGLLHRAAVHSLPAAARDMQV